MRSGEAVNVQEVLRPAAGALVTDQIRATDVLRGLGAVVTRHAARPGLVERYAVDGRQQVHPVRRHAEFKLDNANQALNVWTTNQQLGVQDGFQRWNDVAPEFASASGLTVTFVKASSPLCPERRLGDKARFRGRERYFA